VTSSQATDQSDGGPREEAAEGGQGARPELEALGAVPV